jgi:hypothetical protein
MSSSENFRSAEKVDSRNVFGAERRLTKRVPVALKIEVSGRDPKRGPFHDHTVTIDVSESGCRFQLDREVKRGDELAITCEDGSDAQSNNEPELFHVVWAEPAENGSLIGAMQLRTGNVWPAALMAS